VISVDCYPLGCARGMVVYQTGAVMSVPSAIEGSLFALMLAAMAVSGCAATSMNIEADLAESEILTVRGRHGFIFKQRLRFGTYDTQGLRRSWTHGSDVSVLGYHRERRRQTYRYIFREAGIPLYEVGCEARYRRTTFELFVIEMDEQNRQTLQCRIASVDDPEDTWWLELAEDHGHPMQGALTRGDLLFEVVGTNRFANSRWRTWDATGYHVMDGETALASIEVVNQGAVRLNRVLSADGIDVISAVASAVLLYRDLRE
jgi:hypothetical protein